MGICTKTLIAKDDFLYVEFHCRPHFCNYLFYIIITTLNDIEQDNYY